MCTACMHSHVMESIDCILAINSLVDLELKIVKQKFIWVNFIQIHNKLSHFSGLAIKSYTPLDNWRVGDDPVSDGQW